MTSVYSAYSTTLYNNTYNMSSSDKDAPRSSRGVEATAAGLKDAASELRIAKELAVGEVAEISNAGYDTNYKIKHYRNYMADAGRALVKLQSGDDAKDGMSTHVLELFNGGEADTGDGFVDAVLDALFEEEVDPGTYMSVQVEMPEVNGTAGNDIINYDKDGNILGARTGDGLDMVKLSGNVVSDVKTDQDPGVTATYMQDNKQTTKSVAQTYSNSDYLEVTARTAQGLDTGGGDDIMRVDADYAMGLNGGDGDDKISVQASYAADVNGGRGNDTIGIQASVFDGATGGSGDDVISVSAQASTGFLKASSDMTVEERMKNAVGAARVDGGYGDDTIMVGVGTGINVDGGSGDDLIEIAGGTVAFTREEGDGDDIIEIKGNAELVINGTPSKVTSVTDDILYMEFEDGGSLIIQGVSKASAIAVADETGQIQFFKQNESVDLRL